MHKSSTANSPFVFEENPVLSARGRDAACGGRGGCAEVGVVVVGLGAGQDGVTVGGGAVELQSSEVLGVYWLVSL